MELITVNDIQDHRPILELEKATLMYATFCYFYFFNEQFSVLRDKSGEPAEVDDNADDDEDDN